MRALRKPEEKIEFVKGFQLIPFEAAHFYLMEECEWAPHHDSMLFHNPDTLMHLQHQNTWTLFYDNLILGCAGTVKLWPGRYHGWTMMTEHTQGRMKKVTELTRHVLNGISGRIEMTVVLENELGHKWAKMLGFKVENPPGILQQYGPLGEDHIAYVRINQ